VRPTRQSRSGLDAAGFEIDLTPRTRKPKRHSATPRSGRPAVHIDTLLYPGYAVPPYDDSLLAKIIIRAETWTVALARLRHALDHFEVKGIVTTV
jgi:acetyl-CoA carboxylase, biotin carboxylase subunit